jgi:hypothetical protein
MLMTGMGYPDCRASLTNMGIRDANAASHYWQYKGRGKGRE